VLASQRGLLAEHGVQAVVSDDSFVEVCRDKRATAAWFKDRGLSVPRPMDSIRDARFPLFVKPYDGSCSRDARLIRSAAELTPAMLSDARMMFVEYLSPDEHDEYTIDMYYDRGGTLKCLVPRQRLETRGGEVSKGRTRRVPALAGLRERFAVIAGSAIRRRLSVELRGGSEFPALADPRTPVGRDDRVLR
jgi:carbamoyl-phosphate synthase large subunit